MIKLAMLGYVGQDPRIVDLDGEEAVGISVSVANRKNPIWVSVLMKGSAVKAAKLIKKGDMIYVEGDPWAKVYKGKGSLSMTSYSFSFAGGKKKDSNSNDGSDEGSDLPF